MLTDTVTTEGAEEKVQELQTDEKQTRTITNEALAIIGAVAIVIVSVIALGEAAKDIALAIGGGLVGYLVPYPRK